jgi:DNA polymerase III delta' subunit
VDGFHTVGQPAAVAAVHAMVAARVPHAVLLSGPASVGKRSLALDLAAALLCTGGEGGARPCRACRACRMVEHGNHPDLHRLEPEGPGGQVGIGGKDGKRGVRDLVTELSLLPVEGVARVAIIGDAHRMNEDAQSALLKTLEEPPSGTTLVLCADDVERLLPTVRSRCAHVRLGTVGARDVERLLASRELADPPTAARLARLSGGRPGLAVAYAAAPGAEAVRAEITRTLLDLLGQGRAPRLMAARDLLARATTLASLLAPPSAGGPPSVPVRRSRGRSAGVSTADVAPAQAADDTEVEAGTVEPATKVSAVERRRALALLLDA